MKYILDGKKMISKEETHAYLKETFGFPDYYGNNLDALYDCLTEMGQMEVVFINGADMIAALEKYSEKLLKVFAKADNVKVAMEMEE